MALQMRKQLWDQIRAYLSEEEWRNESGPFLANEQVANILNRAQNMQLVSPRFQSGNVSPIELVLIAGLVERTQTEVVPLRSALSTATLPSRYCSERGSAGEDNHFRPSILLVGAGSTGGACGGCAW